LSLPHFTRIINAAYPKANYILGSALCKQKCHR